MAFDTTEIDAAADAMMATIERQNPSRVRKFRRVCSECGAEHLAGARHADFCSAPCRAAFNNRRAMRGAELYDLIMVLRHERGVARALKVWNVICRLASAYRDEDIAQRGGRKSWRPAQQVIDRHPYLSANVISRATWQVH